MDNNILADYLRLGYRLLPLEPNAKQPLTRLVPNGLKQASNEPETLAQWANSAPTANWGLLPPANVLVLDVDQPAAWPGLLAAYPELGTAPRQRTPRGGYHLFLRLPDGAIGQISASTRKLPGCDIRGLGRAYLAVAPSTIDGTAYTWEQELVGVSDLPEVPPGLLSQLLPPPPPPPPAPRSAPMPVGDERLQKRLRGLLGWACERVAGTPEGARHNTLLQQARLVGGWLHHGLDEAEALEALTAAGVAAGLPEAEARATARDGLAAGRQKPLDLPPNDAQPVAIGRLRSENSELSPSDVWPEPEPLDAGAKLQPWPEGGILPPDVEDYALALADRLCVDPAPVCMGLLVASTAATNGRLWVEPDVDNPTWREPTALWLATVMPVSAKKTPLLKAALAPIWDIEAELREQYEAELRGHEADLQRWESSKRGERGPKPRPPTPKRLLAQDATREALGNLLASNPGILAYHDELSGLFRGWAREDRGADRAFYLSAYSAAPIHVDRILRGSMFVARPVLSLIGYIQPGPFRERILEAQDSDGNGSDGLLQRFMVVTAPERPWEEERPPIPEDFRKRYHDLITRVWDVLHKGPERVLALTPEAQNLWYTWETQTERDLRNPDHPEAWKGLLGKRMGLTARLAAVLSALWEEYNAISELTLRRAITLTMWLEPHARRIWHRAISGNDEPVLRLARKLQAGELRQFSLRDLYRHGVAGIATAEQARRVVEALAEAGWVARDSKNPNRWLVNPRCQEVSGE